MITKIFIKFVLTNGEISVDEEQAKSILKSEAQLIPIRDEKGAWTYETINKAFIIRTVKDHEKMRWWRVEQEKIKAEETAKLEEQRLLNMPPEERERLKKEEEESRIKMREMFADLSGKFKIGNK